MTPATRRARESARTDSPALLAGRSMIASRASSRATSCSSGATPRRGRSGEFNSQNSDLICCNRASPDVLSELMEHRGHPKSAGSSPRSIETKKPPRAPNPNRSNNLCRGEQPKCPSEIFETRVPGQSSAPSHASAGQIGQLAVRQPCVPRSPPSPPVPPWGVPNKCQTVALVSIAQDPNADYRPYMEDGQKVIDPLFSACRKNDQWGFFAVFDGHGGRREVDYCQDKLHEVVLMELQGLVRGKGVDAALMATFQKMDNQLGMLGAWDSGCTATVVLVHRQDAGVTLHVANVGDSRAVIVNQKEARRLTTDHRACDASEVKRILEGGGIVRRGRVGGKLSVSRSLGDHHLKECGVSCVPDICTCDGSYGHALVVASDGLWDALADDDARAILACCIDKAVTGGGDQMAIEGLIRDTAARSLVESAKERGSRDNILALVLFL